MANTGVKGRVVFAGTGEGIPDLTVTAVDFDPFFNEDDVLGKVKTDAQGRFQISYSASAYSSWKIDRKPDIVVRIYAPRYTDPKLFGTRLLHETKEVEEVTDTVLEVGEIKIHPDNIDGWLVTHATLHPEVATPVALFNGNEIEHLVDGDTMFPAITDAVTGAKTSVNLMTLLFEVKSNFITKFKGSFDPLNPPSSNCLDAMEATLEEELIRKAINPSAKLVNVMVHDKPLVDDTATEVEEFFANTGVNTNRFKKGFNILHSKNLIIDGETAIIMGSPLKQPYFSDDRHHIRDARHKGGLHHDVSLKVTGPAVAHINKTFETVWKATGKPLTMITPGQIDERQGDNVASVQVVRTLAGGAFRARGAGDEDIPHGETGILEAYERAINNAERYIYIENQYFTSHEIINALIARMKDSSKPKLHIILVLNFSCDFPGYADRQVDNVNQLKSCAKDNGHQLAAFTIWTRAEKRGVPAGSQPEFEIMPVDVHTKVAIIDDKWATVGSANLDGTSMNYHEIALITIGALTDRLLDKLGLGDDFLKFLWEAFWYLFFFAFKERFGFELKILLKILKFAYKLITDFDATLDKIRETLGDVGDIPGLVRDAFIRTAAHAVPNRARQPMRSVELNLVIYNGIAGLPATTVIKPLRERLWKEHLGLANLPADMQEVPALPTPLNWVDTWNSRAAANLNEIKNEIAPASHPPKILTYTGDTKAKAYLRELKVSTKNLRDKAVKYDFGKCRLEDQKRSFKWPV
ncbi:MAG TPA: phospholipase D family protein [Pyrinomonadaceae bacterium]|jgi:phosphatidylserine/phosphatidylglycerophosphate/cardiolipin synthase-like enzyme